MAWTKERTRKTMTWLDCYGLYREAGVNQFMTQELVDGDSEFVLVAQQDMEAGADAARASQVATTEYVGDALMAIGLAVVGVTGASGWGAIVGAVIAAVGAIVKWLVTLFFVECDKYHCGGYKRNTTTRRKTYRAHVRSLVGVYVPDSWEYRSEKNCYCNHKSHHCRFVQYMHDGLIIRGQDWDHVEGAPSESGEVRGANALVTGGGSKNCHEHWRKHDKARPLNESGGEIPVGKEKKKPWECAENSYYYRAWKVRSILKWITGPSDGYHKGDRSENILCRTMECMEETLEKTSSAGNDSAFNQKRRRGSRWYASIVWMQRDIWELGQHLVSSGKTPAEGWTRLGSYFQESGCSEKALDTIREMAAGKVYTPEELPFPWTPLFAHIDFWQMRKILIAMKPAFPWIRDKKPEGGEPYGEEARERSAVLAPMLIPVREPIMFRIGMKPIPAKLGSTGPGWGTIALGTSATLIGAYAIYKLMAPSEE
jgi:hypothetical protein